MPHRPSAPTSSCLQPSRRSLAAAVGSATIVLGGLLAPQLGRAGEPAAAPTEPSSADPSAREAEPASNRWCAPELESLEQDVCVALPPGMHEPPREVAFFLHGVIAPDGTWQWAQQRSAARAIAGRGVAVLMPRGRRGIRADSMRDWTTWPTSAAAQRLAEHEVLAEWLAARTALEARLGRGFERTYVMGFSNGAYYATSLALRGRLPIDGYAAFAGGIFPGPVRRGAFASIERVPLYVGYGDRDPAAMRDARSFEPALRVLDWPSKVVRSKRVGHAMTDAQAKDAIEFFRARRPLPPAEPRTAPSTR